MKHPTSRAESIQCGIVGAGNSAHALSCYLTQQGHSVSMYARNPAKIEELQRTRIVRSIGKIEGEFELRHVGSEPGPFIAQCQTIFVCTTADAYIDVMDQIGPYLEPGHEFILFSSKFGGSSEVEYYLHRCKRRGIKVMETDALFACRIQEPHSVWIRGFKDWNLYSGPRHSQTLKYGQIVTRFFPSLEPAQNLVQRGLTDFGALAHALTVVVNANSVDRQEQFLFYYEGFTERTIRLLETMEREFQSVANAYGTSLIPARELLDRYYGCTTTSLLQAMKTVPNYRYSTSPESLSTRYLHEDVPCTLVPVHYLAQLAGLRTPVVDSVIAMATVVGETDFLATGRTLERLGWDHYGADEIREWLQR